MVVTKKQLSDFEEVLTELFKKESFIANIAKSISSILRDELREYKEKVNILEEKVVILEAEVTRSKSDNTVCRADHEEKLDRLEQYTRRNSIRVFGVSETDNENTEQVVLDIINKKMNLALLPDSIDRCHRVGPKRNGKNRPIIMKFISHKTKDRVFYHKKLLRGTQFIIREDLTHHRICELRKLEEEYGKRRVWSRDGTLYAEVDGQKKRMLI
nr:uncharacterized protein LOC111429387 [Onthophagus taurus]